MGSVEILKSIMAEQKNECISATRRILNLEKQILSVIKDISLLKIHVKLDSAASVCQPVLGSQPVKNGEPIKTPSVGGSKDGKPVVSIDDDDVTVTNIEFKCPTCSANFTKKIDLDCHLPTHRQTFDCTLCTYSTARKEKLIKHAIEKHGRSEPFPCNVCKEAYAEQAQLQAHKDKDHQEDTLLCDYCTYMTKNKEELEKHRQAIHISPDEYRCKYDWCEYNPQDKEKLEAHVKFVHEQIKDVQCRFCASLFPKNHELENHIKKAHGDQKLYNCPSCDFGTNKKFKLTEHIETNHPKEAEFQKAFEEFQSKNKKSSEDSNTPIKRPSKLSTAPASNRRVSSDGTSESESEPESVPLKSRDFERNRNQNPPKSRDIERNRNQNREKFTKIINSDSESESDSGQAQDFKRNQSKLLKRFDEKLTKIIKSDSESESESESESPKSRAIEHNRNQNRENVAKIINFARNRNGQNNFARNGNGQNNFARNGNGQNNFARNRNGQNFKR